MYKGAMALRHNTVIVLSFLKDPSQPLLFSMPSKLLILHGEAKSCCFTVSCFLKVCNFIFSSFPVIFFALTCSKYSMKAKLLYVNKNKV